MKLQQLKEKMEKELKGTKINKRLRNESQDKNLAKLQVIGITGSKGKSTTAYIIHEYLKYCGYKSVLYSSLGIDSPASITKINEACEMPVNSKETLLSILEEAEGYGAEYLVLEVNENAIDLVKDVEFDVRVLTDFNPKHNEEQYSMEEYKKLKKSFFENIYEECKCVIGLGTNITKEDYQEFIRANDCDKVTFSSKYICRSKSVDYQKIDILLYELENSIQGLKMQVLVDNQNYYLETKTILAHNALNFLCSMATLKALNVLNMQVFQKFIKDMMIPGREEVIDVKGRKIVIGVSLVPALSNFKKYQEMKEIENIKVVIGSVGSGFKTWKEKYKSEEFIKDRKKYRQYAMEYLDNYADYVYLTESDNAKESVEEICVELQGYLKEVPSKIIVDREDAIKEAIKESKEKDLIFISGRGNRRVLCNTENTMKILKDKEVLEKVLTELGWK